MQRIDLSKGLKALSKNQIRRIFSELERREYVYREPQDRDAYWLRSGAERCPLELAVKAYNEICDNGYTRRFVKNKTIKSRSQLRHVMKYSKLERNILIEKHQAKFEDSNTSVSVSMRASVNRGSKIVGGGLLNVHLSTAKQKQIMEDIYKYCKAIERTSDCFDMYTTISIKYSSKPSDKYITVNVTGDTNLKLVEGKIYPSGCERYTLNILKTLKLQTAC
jgi:hypothetical protein